MEAVIYLIGMAVVLVLFFFKKDKSTSIGSIELKVSYWLIFLMILVPFFVFLCKEYL